MIKYIFLISSVFAFKKDQVWDTHNIFKTLPDESILLGKLSFKHTGPVLKKNLEFIDNKNHHKQVEVFEFVDLEKLKNSDYEVVDTNQHKNNIKQRCDVISIFSSLGGTDYGKENWRIKPTFVIFGEPLFDVELLTAKKYLTVIVVPEDDLFKIGKCTEYLTFIEDSISSFSGDSHHVYYPGKDKFLKSDKLESDFGEVLEKGVCLRK